MQQVTRGFARHLTRSDSVRNFLALSSAQVLVAFTGLASTRYLSPANKGLFTGGYLWAAIAYAALGLSLPHALVHFVPRGKAPYLPSGTNRTVGAALLLAGTAVAVFLGIKKGAGPPFWLTLLVLPWLMYQFDLATYRNLSLSGSFYVPRLAQGLAFAVPGVAMVAHFHSPTVLLVVLAASYVLATLGTSGRRPVVREASSIEVAGAAPSLALADVIRWARTAHPGVLLASLSGKVDLLTVTLLSSRSQAGLYAAATAVPGLFSFLGTAMGLATSRQVASSSTSDRGISRRPLHLSVGLFGILLAISVVAFVFSSEILSLLFGPNYYGALAPMRVLVFAIPFWGLNTYLAQVMAVAGFGLAQTRSQAAAVILLGSGSLAGSLLGPLQLVAAANILAYGVASLWQLYVVYQHVEPYERGIDR